MKKLAIALMLILCATAANAGVIYDIQVGGLYTPGDIVTATGCIVTAVAYNGVWVVQPPCSPGNGIWVYLGTHTFVPGDVLDITADYKEYYDLSELDAAGYDDAVPTDTVTLTGHCPPVAPLFATAADIMANAELYEGSYVYLIDGFHVTELLTYGEWKAVGDDGYVHIWFDDVMFDETGLAVGDCFNGVIGVWTYSFNEYKLLPVADGLTVVECAVATETTTFGAVKSLFR